MQQAREEHVQSLLDFTVLMARRQALDPSVGMNFNTINRLAKDVPLKETFKGVTPFLASDFIRIALLLVFPSIALVLVRTFGG